MAVDLEKLPGWPELEASVAGNPHALTIILSATVVALQAHASAQEKMIERIERNWRRKQAAFGG